MLNSESKYKGKVFSMLYIGGIPDGGVEKVEECFERLKKVIIDSFSFRENNEKDCLLNELALLGREVRIFDVNAFLPLGKVWSERMKSYAGEATPTPVSEHFLKLGIVSSSIIGKPPPQLNMVRTISVNLDENGVLQTVGFLGLQSEEVAWSIIKKVVPGGSWKKTAEQQFFHESTGCLAVISPHPEPLQNEFLCSIMTNEFLQAVNFLEGRTLQY